MKASRKRQEALVWNQKPHFCKILLIMKIDPVMADFHYDTYFETFCK